MKNENKMKDCCKKTDLTVRKEFLKVTEKLSILPSWQIHSILTTTIQTLKEYIKEKKAKK